MNRTKLELPDGRLVTIEGGNAADTARFITQACQRPYLPKPTGGLVSCAAVEALPLPVLNFGEPASGEGPDPASSGEVLPLPALNFRK